MPELPEIVYKYRDWENQYHKKILTENEIYLASPKDYNDPFDCRITDNFYLLTEDKDIKEYATILSNRLRNELENKGVDIEQNKRQLFERLKYNKEFEQKEHQKRVFKLQDERYGVFSLSVRWDSILMWGHYANNHKGFCIGFYEEALRNSGRFGKGSMINYSDEYPEIDPREEHTIEKSFKQTHTKASDWSYEEEYRLMKLFEQKATLEDRLVNLDDKCFAEIILGLNISENNEQKIVKIAEQKNLPVYKISQVPFKFELTRNKIN